MKSTNIPSLTSFERPLKDEEFFFISDRIHELVENYNSALESVVNSSVSPENDALYHTQLIPLARISGKIQDSLAGISYEEGVALSPEQKISLGEAFSDLMSFAQQNRQTLRSIDISKYPRGKRREVQEFLSFLEHISSQRLEMESLLKMLFPEYDEGSAENKRREFLRTGTVLISGAALSGLSRIGLDRWQAAQSEPEIGIPERKERSSGMLTEQFLASLEELYGSLTSQEAIFVDQEGNIIKEPIFLKDYIFPEDAQKHGLPGIKEPTLAGAVAVPPDLAEKVVTPVFAQAGGRARQEWLDKWRKWFKKEFPTIDLRLEPERELPAFYSPYGQLRDMRDRLEPKEGEQSPKPSPALEELLSRPDVTCVEVVDFRSEMLVGNTGKTKLEYARDVFSKTNLPKELQDILVYGICGVESAFDSTQVSLVGAKGDWQIMESKGENLGLIRKEKGKTIDERADFEKATPAVAKYFSQLYDLFSFEGKILPIQIYKELEESLPKKNRGEIQRALFGYNPLSSLFNRRWKTDSEEDIRAICERFRLSETVQEKIVHAWNRSDLHPLRQIQLQCGLEKKDLVFPCVVSGYHTGENRVDEVLRWFLGENQEKIPLSEEEEMFLQKQKEAGIVDEKPPIEHVQKVLKRGPYGLDVYTYMTQEAVETRAISGYKKNSRNYFFQVLAMSRLLQEKKAEIPTKEIPGTSPEEYHPPADLPFWKKHRNATAAWLLGVAGTVGLHALLRPESSDSKEKTPRISRRSLLKLAALQVGAATTGVAVSGKMPAPEIPEPPPEGAEEIPVTLPISDEEPESGFVESDELKEQLLGEEFISREKLRALRESGYMNRTLPEKQQPKINRWMENLQDHPRKYVIPTRFKNERHMLRGIRLGILVPLDIPEVSKTYRIRGLGETKYPEIGSEGNHSSYICTRPHMKELLEEIGEEFNEEVREKLGLSEKYSVRFTVTSASRPQDYGLKNKSANSAHPLGLALDLGRNRFDILDASEKEFYTLDDDDPEKGKVNEVNNKYGKLNLVLRAILENVLLKMHQEGKIIFNPEGIPPHLHIFSTDTEPFLRDK